MVDASKRARHLGCRCQEDEEVGGRHGRDGESYVLTLEHYQVKLELKEALCEAKKENVAKELQETYNVMLRGRDLLQFEARY